MQHMTRFELLKLFTNHVIHEYKALIVAIWNDRRNWPKPLLIITFVCGWPIIAIIFNPKLFPHLNDAFYLSGGMFLLLFGIIWCVVQFIICLVAFTNTKNGTMP